MNRQFKLGCIALLLAVFTVPALAQTWQLTSGSGSFQSPFNWSPAEVPGVGDAAMFSVPGESTVTFASSVQNASATFGAASGIDVALDLGASTWSLDDLAYNNPATVRLNSGTLQVANQVSTLRRLILNGGAANFPGSLRTDAYNVNRLEVHGGSHAAHGLYLRSNVNEPDGLAMRMTAGTFSCTDQLFLNGPRIALEGGRLDFNTINFYGPGTSSITVNTNASLTGTGYYPTIYLGRQGKDLSTLNIHGGVVSNVYALLLGNVGSNHDDPSTSVVHLVDGELHAGGGNTDTGGINLGYFDNRVAFLKQDGGKMVFNGPLNFGGKTALNTHSELHLNGGELVAHYTCRVGYHASSYGLIHKTGGGLLL